MEERSVREAPYPSDESGTLHKEALDVGAVDVGESKVERPSLGVALSAGASLGVCVAVDDGDRLAGKGLSQGAEEAGELGGW
jgi:hypothetical protein